TPVMLADQQLLAKKNIHVTILTTLFIQLALAGGIVIVHFSTDNFSIRDVNLFLVSTFISITSILVTIFAVNRRNLAAFRILTILMVIQVLCLCARCNGLINTKEYIELLQIHISVVLCVCVLILSCVAQKWWFEDEEAVIYHTPCPQHPNNTYPVTTVSVTQQPYPINTIPGTVPYPQHPPYPVNAVAGAPPA
ncbi:hypothetical protein PENTCL1PPCAC_25048, partial [Pristionchus entomophagus]